VAPAGPSPRRSPLPVPAHFPATIEIEGRDPYSLSVHWQADASGVPPGRSLRLRLFAHSLEGPWMLEQPVSPSGHRTLPVLYANTVYIASLGIVSESGTWHPLAVSAPVRTAPDAPTHSWTSVMALFPGADISTGSSDEPGVSRGFPTASMLTPPGLPDETTAGLLATVGSESLEWGPDAASSGSVARRPLPRTDIVRGADLGASPTPGSAAWTPASVGVPGSVPVPSPASPPPPGFWFRIHAELILHGSTEPGASVTIGGHAVRLRDDGSFTFRFSLPNGSFELPVEAVKADGSDRRSADLAFTRHTVERGDVGVHPIDPSLKPPLAESVR
jgi:hypothetical protein